MAGFVYTIECIDKQGNVKWTEVVENIVPTAAQDHIISAALLSGVRYANWYVGIFGNDYTPLAADTMSSFITSAGEIITYDETTRPAFTPDAVAAGLLSNFDAPAEFTFNDDDDVYGGFICSSSVKSSGSGMLLSAAQFTSPRSVLDGEGLRVRAGVQLAST
jgi:hypothetical protein